MRLLRIRHDLLFILFSFLFLISTSLAHAAGPDNSPLLNFSNAKGLQNKNEAWIAEKYELLETKINASALVSEKFILTLPNGKQVSAKAVGLEEKALGKSKVITSSGTIEAGDSSLDIFTVSVANGPDGEAVYGVFNIDGKEWLLEKNNKKPNLTLSLIDHSKLPGCPDTIHSHGELELGSITASAEQLAAEGQTTIDILLVYPPATTSNAGGSSAIAATLANWTTWTNNAYQRSQMNYQIKLAAAVEVQDGSSSTSLETMLYELRNSSDGYWDSAFSLREQHAADLIGLIAPAHDGRVCGIAYLRSSSVPFSVSGLNCGSATYAHELGHNMGFQHNVENAGSTSGDNHGENFYGVSGQQFRTIMAYAPGSRIQNFSNPDVSYDGAATGIQDISNNARNGNANASIIAGYRDNPQVCDVRLADISISPSSQTNIAGSDNSYTVTVRNNDTTACLAADFNLSVSATGGISASLAAQSLSVSPGSSRSTILTLGAPLGTADGSYSAQVTITDLSGTHSTDSATAILTIDSTPPEAVAVSTRAGKGKKGGVIVSWTASSEATDYDVYRNDQLIASSSSTSFTDRNVSTGQTYSYYVIARKGSIESDQSNVSTITVGGDGSGGGGEKGNQGKGKNK